MDYKIKFKRLEEGEEPEENYASLKNGLQYQGAGSGLQSQWAENVPEEVLFSIGVLLGQMTSGHAQEDVVPKGRTLEVIFKEE